MKVTTKPIFILFCAVMLNYGAQIPYYLHQYYFPHHLAPSPLGVLLLGITLLWFLIGYYRYLSAKKHGRVVLLGFLLAQVLFYGQTIVLGIWTGAGAVAQLKTQSLVLLVIFIIGYINFLVALYYVYWLIKTARAESDS